MVTSVELVLEGTEESLFHTIDNLTRLPEVDDEVYLDGVGYKVEKIVTHLANSEQVNSPISGQIAPWALSQELYKLHLSLLP